MWNLDNWTQESSLSPSWMNSELSSMWKFHWSLWGDFHEQGNSCNSTSFAFSEQPWFKRDYMWEDRHIFFWIFSITDFMLRDLSVTCENLPRGKFVMQVLSCKYELQQAPCTCCIEVLQRAVLSLWLREGDLEAAVSLYPSFLPQSCKSKLGAWLKKDVWRHWTILFKGNLAIPVSQSILFNFHILVSITLIKKPVMHTS